MKRLRDHDRTKHDFSGVRQGKWHAPASKQMRWEVPLQSEAGHRRCEEELVGGRKCDRKSKTKLIDARARRMRPFLQTLFRPSWFAAIKGCGIGCCRGTSFPCVRKKVELNARVVRSNALGSIDGSQLRFQATPQTLCSSADTKTARLSTPCATRAFPRVRPAAQYGVGLRKNPPSSAKVTPGTVVIGAGPGRPASCFNYDGCLLVRVTYFRAPRPKTHL